VLNSLGCAYPLHKERLKLESLIPVLDRILIGFEELLSPHDRTLFGCRLCRIDIGIRWSLRLSRITFFFFSRKRKKIKRFTGICGLRIQPEAG